MVRIRRASVADREIVLTLAQHVAASLPYASIIGGATRTSLEHLVDQLFELEDSAVIFLAYDGAEPIGGLALCAAMHPITDTPFVNDVAWWVEPDRRNVLAGVRLLEAAEQWTVERKLSTLSMAAPIPSNLHEFFETRGYIPIETTYLKELA